MSRVLVVGDSHCPAMRSDYIPFLKSVYKQYRCDEVVHIGDLVDWHSISYHEPETSLKSPDSERVEAQEQVYELMNSFPTAKRRRLLLGNHDSLPDRKAKTMGLPADYGTPFKRYWNLKGWSVIPRFAELVIDRVVYIHGEGPGGKFAHINQAISRGRSVVMGHLHSNAGVAWHANAEQRLFGLAVGCGIDMRRLQFMYAKPFPRKPILGCGVVIDGVQAYFEPMQLPTK